MEREKKLRRGGLVGPLVLIGAGAIALLTNLGYLDWGIWGTLLRIWPVFLIAAGLDLLIGRRSAIGSLLVLVLILAVFAAGIWVAWRPVSGSAVGGDAITIPLGDAKQAEILVSRSAGELQIGALSTSRNLVEGTIAYREGETAMQEASTRGDTAIYSLRNAGNLVGPFWGTTGETWLWSLLLSKEVTLSLEVNSAAGRADLDLTDLRIDQLQVSQAVGQTTIVLPRDGNLTGKVDGAIGLTQIVVPASQEARIRFDTALVARELPDRFERHDNLYKTEGFDRAESRIDLEIGLILGSVEVTTSQ